APLGPGGGDPGGALKAAPLTKPGPGRGEPVVQCGLAHPARGFGLTEWPVHGVQKPEALDRALAQVAPVALKRRTAADVEVPQVDGRMAVDDPTRQRLSAPTGGLDTDGIKAGRHVQAAQLRRLPEQIAIVGGEALRPVEEQLYPGRLQCRHASHRTGEQRLDVSKIRGQLLEGEALGYPALAPGLGLRLEPP